MRLKHDAFMEDPVRVLRLARFAARLGFDIAPETVEIAHQTAPKLVDEAEERLWMELTKSLEQAKTPRKFFDVARAVGALSIILPRLDRLANVPAGPEKYHAEGSVYEHTMRVLEEAHKRRPNNKRLLLAALFHDFGKVETPPSEFPSHNGHEAAGSQVVREIAERFKVSDEERQVMIDAALRHSALHDAETINDGSLISLIEHLTGSHKNLSPDELVDLTAADAAGREPPIRKETYDDVRALLQKAEDAYNSVSGQEILNQGFSGEKVGEILHQERARELKRKR